MLEMGKLSLFLLLVGVSPRKESPPSLGLCKPAAGATATARDSPVVQIRYYKTVYLLLNTLSLQDIEGCRVCWTQVALFLFVYVSLLLLVSIQPWTIVTILPLPLAAAHPFTAPGFRMFRGIFKKGKRREKRKRQKLAGIT
jgi:hypothetical protein